MKQKNQDVDLVIFIRHFMFFFIRKFVIWAHS